MVAHIRQHAGLLGGQRAGGRIGGGGWVGVDLERIAHRLVPGTQGDGVKLFCAVCGKDRGHTAAGGHGAVAAEVVGAVVLVDVVIVVGGLDLVEVAIVVVGRGVLIGDVVVAVVAVVAAPTVFDDPGAVFGRSGDAVEVGAGVVVIPAHDGDVVVGVVKVVAAVFGVLDVAISAGAVVGIVVLVAVAEGARAVGHDGVLDGVHVHGGDPVHALDVGDVVLVGVGAAQTCDLGVGISKGRGGLAGRALPAHEGVGGHLSVAAQVEIVAVGLGQIALEHIQRVIGIGIVVPRQMVLRQVHGLGCRLAGCAVDDAVLDHIGLDRGNRTVGPAGAVAALVAHSGDVALVGGIVVFRQIVLRLNCLRRRQIGVGQGGGAGMLDINLACWVLAGLHGKALGGQKAQNQAERQTQGQKTREGLFHGCAPFR